MTKTKKLGLALAGTIAVMTSIGPDARAEENCVTHSMTVGPKHVMVDQCVPTAVQEIIDKLPDPPVINPPGR